MESIRSSDCFYINAQYLNTTTTDQPAEVLVLDDSALLQRSEGYAIHLTRWSLDTQTSLYFVKADEAKQVTIALMAKHGQGWHLDREQTFYVDENLPTVTAFLQWWNSQKRAGDSVFPRMSIDGAGRFHLEAEFTKPITQLGNAPGGVYDYMARVQMSDPMSALIGFETLKSSVTYDVSNYRNVCDVLNFVKTVIEEDRPEFFLQIGGSVVGHNYNYINSLRDIGVATTRYLDQVKHTGAGGVPAGQATHIMTSQQSGSENRIPINTWAKLYWDEMDGAFPISMSQYVYITGFQDGPFPIVTGYTSEYVTGGSPNSPEAAISFAPYQWHRGPLSPLIPLVYNTTDRETGQLIDQESLYGYERTMSDELVGVTAVYASYLMMWVPAEPDVVYLPGTAPVQIGDLLEIPCDISPNHRIALYQDGTLLPDAVTPSHWGTTANFQDRGVYYSWPVMDVTITAQGLRRCVIMLPIPPNIGIRLMNQVNIAVAQQAVPPPHLQPTVFISGKRPPFIPMVHRHAAILAAVAPPTVTLTLPYCPVQVGDSIWVRQPALYFGPFVVLTVTHNPAAVPPTITVTVSSVNWPATYDEQTDYICVVNQLQRHWYAQDVDEIKKMFPVWMTQIAQNTNWAVGHIDGTLCNALAINLHTTINQDLLFAQSYASIPKQEQRRTVYATTDFPTLVEAGPHHRLQLQNLVVSSTGQWPFSVVRSFSDTRYDYRAPNYVHQMVLLQAPGFESLMALHPDEHFELDPTKVANQIAAPEWLMTQKIVICGTEGSNYIVVCNVNGFIAPNQALNEAESTELTVVYSQSEKLGTILRQGNNAHSVQLPGYISGRTLNMTAHDYMRSTYQGQVDLCQAFHSIVISSRDIGVLPERSNQMRSLAPIISSYLIGPTIDAISADKYGNAKGYSETPYGTVQFVERIRRFHKLQRIPGDLRSFTIQAEICPRDTRLQPTQVLLAPGESFSCQLMFVKEF